MSYGVKKPSEYDSLDSFNYRQWFQNVYSYIRSRVQIHDATANYTVEANVYMVRADATIGARTITLPTPLLIAGRQITVKKVEATANNVIVQSLNGELIDGAATKTWNSGWLSYTFISNGTTWDII
jgi:hypothetical protein